MPMLIADKLCLLAVYGYSLALWYHSLFSRPSVSISNFCSFTLKLVIALVLYSSVFGPAQWALVAVPQLVRTSSTTTTATSTSPWWFIDDDDEISSSPLAKLVQAFPSGLQLGFVNNTFSVLESDEEALYYALELDYTDWNELTKPLRLAPMIDLVRTLRTPAVLYDTLYRVGSGAWLSLLTSPPPSTSAGSSDDDDDDYALATTRSSTPGGPHEFRVGERVRRRGSTSSHTIAAYYPSNYLNDFSYLLQDDGEEGEAVPIGQLQPAALKVYFFPTANNNNSKPSIPLDANVVFTSTHVALLPGYSFHFNNYWQRTIPTSPTTSTSPVPPPNDTDSDPLQQCAAQIDPTRWNEVEMCPPAVDYAANAKVWSPLSSSSSSSTWDHHYLKSDSLVRPLLALFCEAAADQQLVCSRDVAERKLAALRQSYAPFFTPHAHLAWFTVLFAVQVMVVTVLAMLFASVVFAPLCWLGVNVLLLHVDDNPVDYLQCLHSSLRASLSATVLFASFPSSTPLFAYILAYLAVNCAGLYLRHHGEHRALAKLRARFLRAFYRRRPGRARPSPVPPSERTCRICLTTGEDDTMEDGNELISPCVCDGSMQFVHRDCLQEWRLRASNTKSLHRCDQCQYPYVVRRDWRDVVFRSNACIVLLAAATVLLGVALGAVAFLVVDKTVYGANAVMCELLLGAKSCAFAKEGAWALGEPAPAMEKRVVEWLSARLQVVGGGGGVMDLSHVAPSIALWGLVGFFQTRILVFPWDVGFMPGVGGGAGGGGGGEGGVVFFLGDRFLLLIGMGLLRWLALWWAVWRNETRRWITGVGGTQPDGAPSTLEPQHQREEIESVPPVPWEISRGTVLRTPFGAARVVAHRAGVAVDDDVVEMELAGGQGFRLFRSAVLSAQEDTEMLVEE